MKLYLAGPMRGKPYFNFPAFHAAAAKLRAEGYEVFNPAEKGVEHGATEEDMNSQAFRRKVFALDLAWICEHADEIALLPGWEHSAGAVAERYAARALDLRLRFL